MALFTLNPFHPVSGKFCRFTMSHKGLFRVNAHADSEAPITALRACAAKQPNTTKPRDTLALRACSRRRPRD
jgi:hypothetical protein